MSVPEIDSLKEATLKEGSASVPITKEDADKMRAALLKALEESELGDRDTMMAFAEPLPAWIDGDENVMIAGWLLQLRNQQLVATWWLSKDDDRAVGYSAYFLREKNGWRVTKIVPQKARFR